MSLGALKKMRDMGLSLEQAIDLLETLEAETPSAGRSRAAERQRAYRERKAHNENVTRDVTRDVTDPRPLSLSPQTPLTHTPTPEDITTGARKADLAEPFSRFWTAYPRKVGKPLAAKAYAKAHERLERNRCLDPPAEILAGLNRQLDGFSQREPDLVPHPTTWLNRDGWDDQPDTPRQAKPAGSHVQPYPDQKHAARLDNYRAAFEGAQAASRMREVG